MDMDFLSKVERRLDMPPAEKEQVIRELRSHYDEVRDELMASGMDTARIDQEVERRLGSPSDIAARLNAVHNTASWKSAMLAAVPFAASVAYLAAAALRLASGIRFGLLIAIAAAMLAGSVRGLLAGRRPIWLPVWFAAMIICVPDILYELSPSVPWIAGGRANAAAVLILAVMVLAISVRVRRWLATIAIAGTLGFLSAVLVLMSGNINSANAFVVVIMVLSAVMLLVLLARLVFEAHEYGSGTQASLFLLAALTLKYSISTDSSVGWLYAVLVTLCGLGVVWFMRVPTRRGKAQACYVVLLISNVLGQSTTVYREGSLIFNIPSTIIGAAITAAVYQFIVLWPMKCEESMQDRPTVAQ